MIDLSEKVVRIWKKGQNLEKKEAGIWKNCRILNGLRFWSGFTGFEVKNRQPTGGSNVSGSDGLGRLPISMDTRTLNQTKILTFFFFFFEEQPNWAFYLIAEKS